MHLHGCRTIRPRLLGGGLDRFPHSVMYDLRHVTSFRVPLKGTRLFQKNAAMIPHSRPTIKWENQMGKSSRRQNAQPSCRIPIVLFMLPSPNRLLFILCAAKMAALHSCVAHLRPFSTCDTKEFANWRSSSRFFAKSFFVKTLSAQPAAAFVAPGQSTQETTNL